MEATAPSQHVHVPLSERINLRILLFAAVMMVLIGFPIYVYLDALITGGIKDAGNGYFAVDLKAMSSFSFDQDHGTIDDVPKKWRELDGKKVILQGEMYSPQGAGASVESFELVYSIAKCCLTGAPQVQHFVKSRASKGADLPYYASQVKVTGTLHVNVTKDPETGKVTGVYYFDVDQIEPS